LLYEDIEKAFPPSNWGCCWGTWQAAILDYIEQANVHYKLLGKLTYSSGPNLRSVSVLRLEIATCPSDEPRVFPAHGVDRISLPMAKHNMVVNYGNTGLTPVQSGKDYRYVETMPDGSVYTGAPFTPYDGVPLSHITDGLSKTMMLSETIQGNGEDTRGLTWWGDGAGFSTYLSPNTNEPDRIFRIFACKPEEPNPPCAQISADFPSMYAARSRHPGVVNAAMCDGSVHTISDSIDLFVWRAMGSTEGAEIIDEGFKN